jgi:hypothetical protein
MHDMLVENELKKPEEQAKQIKAEPASGICWS